MYIISRDTYRTKKEPSLTNEWESDYLTLGSIVKIQEKKNQYSEYQLITSESKRRTTAGIQSGC